jgi:hypothetical protein
LPHNAPQSEVWFDDYVRTHGHNPGEPEPDLGVGKSPDRLIRWNGHEVVCEIKQFESGPFSQRGEGAGVMDMKEVLGPVRRKVTRAAAQLKPLASTRWPLVVVLADPKSYGVPLSGHEMVWALYGDPVIRVTINIDISAAAAPAEHTVGRNSRLLRDHQYVSAVVTLQQCSHLRDWHNARWEQLKAEHADFDPGDIKTIGRLADQLEQEQDAALANGEIEGGDYLCAEVFTATSQTAVPLPRDVFDGPRDARWDYNPETGDYKRTRGYRASESSCGDSPDGDEDHHDAEGSARLGLTAP